MAHDPLRSRAVCSLPLMPDRQSVGHEVVTRFSRPNRTATQTICGISSVADLSYRPRLRAIDTEGTIGRIAVDKPPRAVRLLVCLLGTVAVVATRAGATPRGVRAGAASRPWRGGRSCPLCGFGPRLSGGTKRRRLPSGGGRWFERTSRPTTRWRDAPLRAAERTHVVVRRMRRETRGAKPPLERWPHLWPLRAGVRDSRRRHSQPEMLILMR